MIGGKGWLAALVSLALVAGCQQAGDKAGHEQPAADIGGGLPDADTRGLDEALLNAHDANGGLGDGNSPGADGGGAGPDGASFRDYENYIPTEPMKAAHEEMTLKLADRLISRCLRATGQGGLNACMHERLLAGFDATGKAKQHCTEQIGQEVDALCIMVGSAGYQIAEKIGADAVAEFDWSNPSQSAEEAMRKLVLQKIRECLGGGSASDPSECITARITTALDLTEGDVSPCNSLRDEDREFGRCLGDAFSLKFVELGIARM